MMTFDTLDRKSCHLARLGCAEPAVFLLLAAGERTHTCPEHLPTVAEALLQRSPFLNVRLERPASEAVAFGWRFGASQS